MNSIQKVKGRPRQFDRKVALNRALEVFWHRGYDSTTVTDLCASMEISPPSLYAAFGNKESLFLEAVQHYEDVYWSGLWKGLLDQPDLFKAVDEFFVAAARVLSSPKAPCGCLVVLAAVNVSPGAGDIYASIKSIRDLTYANFLRRMQQAQADERSPVDCVPEQTAASLATLLFGMSIQARDGATPEQLLAVAKTASKLLPSTV